jgi:hypothetical protein
MGGIGNLFLLAVILALCAWLIRWMNEIVVAASSMRTASFSATLSK